MVLKSAFVNLAITKTKKRGWDLLNYYGLYSGGAFPFI
jgi:hypothetical protein